MPTALIVVSLGLGVMAIVRAWFGGGGVHAGLWGAEACNGSGCSGARWDNIPGADFDLILAGYAGAAAAIATAVLGVLTGVARLGGQRGPIKPALTTSTIALVAIAYFVIRMIIDNAPLDWGTFVGAGCAIATSVLLRRRA